ncbi:MAG: MFS transporter [Planctomycetes bacterium]|nr:MFS transporter [Planctomycetota bacterium]
MKLSLFEGVFYALMVGLGETYFLADAIRLGARPFEQALLITLPLFLGGLGSVAALRILSRLRRRKGLVVGSCLGQGLLLLALAQGSGLGWINPTLLITISVLHHVLGQAAGTAWSSWYGDLVPAEIRGRYFARRNRGVHLATCAGLAFAGFALDWLEPGRAGEVAAGRGGERGSGSSSDWRGGFRLLSVLLLAFSPEPEFRGVSPPAKVLRFLRTTRGRSAWRMLLTGAGLQFLVYIGSPYFGPFMLEELHFSYAAYMAAAATVVAAKFILLPVWGRLVDQHGARPVYSAAALLVAIVPLPWLWADGLGWVLPAQALSGLSWAAYEVSYFSLLLESSLKQTRPHAFAAQNVLNGTGQLLGSLVGAALIGLTGRDFQLVFLATLIGRLALALFVPRILPADAGRRSPGRGEILLRVIGVRPHGGVVHRPMDDPGGESRKGNRESASGDS